MKNKRIYLMMGGFLFSGLIFGLTDTRCPTLCPTKCAVASANVPMLGCASWRSGYANTIIAEAEISMFCIDTMLFPVVVAQDTVNCHGDLEIAPWPDEDGDDDCASCGHGACPPQCNPY